MSKDMRSEAKFLLLAAAPFLHLLPSFLPSHRGEQKQGKVLKTIFHALKTLIPFMANKQIESCIAQRLTKEIARNRENV